MSPVKKAVIIAVLCIIAGAGIFWFSLRPQYVVPVLMYHSVNPVPNDSIKSLIVSPRTFERQMRFLRDHHYNVITVEALARLIKTNSKIPPKTVAVTFDDGYKDNYTYAFPVLKKYAIPATIFIIIDEVGRPLTKELKAGDARLSWQEIHQMQSSGLVDFGSHTFGAEPLVDKRSDAALKKEIVDSRAALGERLGRQVAIFSYPGGLFNDKIKTIVMNAGYFCAVATTPGRRYPDTDPFIIKRVRVSESIAGLAAFWWDVSGYYVFFKEKRRR
jgi:peptidoglycan/xylan/chitin deacetylase (PgdA/CDA1 family)